MGADATELAGQALADALKSVADNGLTGASIPALQVATVMTDAAIRQGATPEEIRRAAGLPAA